MDMEFRYSFGGGFVFVLPSFIISHLHRDDSILFDFAEF